MTTSKEPAQERRFVGTFLPWVVAFSGLIFYLATMSRWFSLGNLGQAARITGDLPGAELYAPIYFLITYPLHWIPAHWVPLALNILSAVCGALVLGQLARSIVLLPHDRTHDQRLREDGEFSLLTIRAAWIPPVLAAAVLGFQLTIWESATTGARELLDLALIAYIIRCLLEFRINERDSWLYRAAAVYGAAMTENWVLVGLLPAFGVALVWIRGISFFNLRFLRGMILLGSLGLLLYLVLPLVYVNSNYDGGGTFWQALKMNLKSQRDIISIIIHRVPGNILLLLALTSFLPMLLIAIKWASHFGDPSPAGIALTKGVFHLSHGALLGACIWAAFDPAFGPRHMAAGLPALILMLIYLATLSIGYFTGYFLLVFRPLNERSRRQPFWNAALHQGTQALIWGLLLLVPAGLIFKNLPRINSSNGPTLTDYARQLTQNLPEHAVVLSDDPMRMLLAKAWLDRAGKPSDRIFLNTQNLVSPIYFNEQQKLHSKEWVAAVDTKKLQPVDPKTLIELVLKLSDQRPVYYLHPSFGYYFEYLYLVPHGLVYEMRRCSTNAIATPPLTDTDIAENENFWKGSGSTARSLLPFIVEPATGPHPTFRQLLLKKLHVLFEPSPMAATLANYYSLGLNFWGGQMEVAGKLPEAGKHFELALKLNENNISARRNVEFNRDLQAGIPPSVGSPQSVKDDLGKYRDWQQVMREGGPYDEPTHRFAQGVIFGQAGLNRQAAMQFERIATLVPDYLPSQLWLAQFYILNRFPEKALAMIPHIRQQAEMSADPGAGRFDILKVEVTALFAADQAARAERLLQEQMDQYPNDLNLLTLVFQVSTSFRSFTNALHAVDLALKIKPDDIGALVNKGYLSIQIHDTQTAITVLSAALAMDTNNATAKLNRAIAYLVGDKLDEACKDYSEMEKQFPGVFQIYYGLGEIAWRRKDTNNAIHYYDLYIANAPADTDEARTIGDRLQNLRAAAP